MLQQLRLLGLVLFITSLFLALAAAVSQTAAIQVRNPFSNQGNEVVPRPAADSGNAPAGGENTPGEISAAVNTGTETSVPTADEFVTVAIVYPLTIAGFVGLLLWFVPAGLTSPSPKKKKRRRRKRR